MQSGQQPAGAQSRAVFIGDGDLLKKHVELPEPHFARPREGQELFWPWGASDSGTLINSKEVTSIPVVISYLGRYWLPAGRRLSRYKYEMYTETAGGGDMRCASLRTTVSLAVMGFPVRSVNHLYGPFPTTYTWGYYRSDVSCLFGTFLDKGIVMRQQAWRRDACKNHRTRGLVDPGLYPSAAWFGLLTCLHAHFNDPREPPSARPTDIVQEAGTGLTNVVLWDLAFLDFAPATSHYTTKATMDRHYGGHMQCYTFVFLNVALFRPALTAGETHGLETHFRIWYTADPFSEEYALGNYSLTQRLRGCKVFSSRDSDVMRIQQNLTGLTAEQRQAADALVEWVLADSGAERAPVAAEVKRSQHSGVLPQRLTHGEGVCYRYRHA